MNRFVFKVVKLIIIHIKKRKIEGYMKIDRGILGENERKRGKKRLDKRGSILPSIYWNSTLFMDS